MIFEYRYDAVDRLKQVTFGDSSVVQYAYDSIGRPVSVSDLAAGAGTIGYAYDTLNRVTQETSSAGSVSYTYDNLGRRATMTVAGEPTVGYTYDDNSRPTAVSKSVAGVLRNYALGYDAGGRRSSLQIPSLLYDKASAKRVGSLRITKRSGGHSFNIAVHKSIYI